MPVAARAPSAAVLALLAGLVLAGPSGAGTARCWVDENVLVVPAMVAGVPGDYILDTGTAHTQLHETRAQAAGFAAASVDAEIRIAGLRLPARPVAVVDLDARTYAFPTPIAGVIGADVLDGHVLDVSFAPCRVGLWAAGRAPRFGPGRRMSLAMADGRPVTRAAVADGPNALAGGFVLATGLDAPVRIARSQGSAPGTPGELLPAGAQRPRLRALSLNGQLWEEVPAGLVLDADLPAEALGEIGPQILARWRLRFDPAAGALTLGPRRR